MALRKLTSTEILEIINENYKPTFRASYAVADARKFLKANLDKDSSNLDFLVKLIMQFAPAFAKDEHISSSCDGYDYFTVTKTYSIDMSKNINSRNILDAILTTAGFTFTGYSGFSAWFIHKHVYDTQNNDLAKSGDILKRAFQSQAETIAACLSQGYASSNIEVAAAAATSELKHS